jgi:L-malate glycosyltransferase
MSSDFLKVGYLLGSLNRGGTETLLLDMFKKADQAPFRMIGIYRKEGDLTEDFHSSPAPVYKISPGKKRMILLYLIRLNRLVRKYHLDIIHANQSIDTLYARLACLGLRVKIIQTTHEFDNKYSRSSKLLKCLSFKIADINLFVSHTLFKQYKLSYKLREDKVSVIFNTIDFEKFRKVSNTSLRTLLGIEPDVVILGMVGNFTPVHDQATICRFLALLNQQGINFIFLFVGAKDVNNPQLFDECKALCQINGIDGKVIFLGSRPDVPELLPQLDAFTYSSNHDSFGIAVIEAIAAGIPVFVNDWDVMKEITDNGERAILYRSKDEKDLFEKFMHFYSKPHIYRKEAAKNALWAINKFNIQKYFEELYRIYALR